VSDELVFVTSLEPTVSALSRADGTEVWSAPRDGALSDSSPVYHDGRVFVGSGGGSIYAYDAVTGDTCWQYTGESAIISSPVVREGTVYVGRNDGVVLALTEDGVVEWTTDLGVPIYSDLRYSASRNYVYVSTEVGTVHALDATDGGQEVWSKRSNADVSASSPIVDETAGLVYFAANEVMALDAGTGEPAWVTTFYGTNAGSSPVVVDGRVFVGGADGNVYALPNEGGRVRSEPEWAFRTRSTITGDPVTHGEAIVTVTLEGTLYRLDADDGAQRDALDLGSEVRASPVAADGALYVGTEGGSIVALE
jgi:outer membrane protein assembly factor BamB